MAQRGLMVLPTPVVAVAVTEPLAVVVVVQVVQAAAVRDMVMALERQQLLVQLTEVVAEVAQGQAVMVRLVVQVLLFFVTLIHYLLRHLLRVLQQLQQLADIVITRLPPLVQLHSESKQCLTIQEFGHAHSRCKQWLLVHGHPH